MRGLLVTLEGIDGSGKSSALKRITSRLEKVLPERKIVITAEPTNGEVGKLLRRELAKSAGEGSEAHTTALRMQELFLFMADHAQHLSKTIIPSLEKGAIVLSDRYADSTAAYQGVTMRGIVPDPVSWIQNISLPWNVRPDRTLLFLLKPEIALKRIRARSDREKFERLEFLRLVDENFRAIAALEPQRFVLIDAGQSEMVVAKEATEAILNII